MQRRQINRRQFLTLAAAAVSSGKPRPGNSGKLGIALPIRPALRQKKAKPYGSGYFGEWMTDLFGLPAYRYTCDQIHDPKAHSPVHKRWRGSTDHTHQVGNDRLVAAVSNYGYAQVRQDEGSPKFLNDYCPDQGCYGGGIGFLTDGNDTVSTFYSGSRQNFERTLGEGYYRKKVSDANHGIDQVLFAPFGDDPVLISQTLITNHGRRRTNLRWVEYWGCQNHQFSYRAGMQAAIGGVKATSTQIRRQFATRFAHKVRVLPNARGLIEAQHFLGRTSEDQQSWESVKEFLNKNPSGFYGGALPDSAVGTSMEDLNPPSTFLVSLDAPADGWATNATTFFGSGGVARPSGLGSKLNNELGTANSDCALLLERHLELQPGESRSVYFMYGYLPEGFTVDTLVTKYQTDLPSLWARSSAQWKSDGIRLRAPSAPWVERETSWHNYYLRSNLTYDSFFREHILSQGHVYQYLLGFQGAARDPLQHALPFVFSNPAVVREVIRYTLKEIQPDGSLPYGIVGCGVPMPILYRPSDQELWLLWLTSEYVLATRDRAFLDERIPAYPRQATAGTDPTIRQLLKRSYARVVETIGTGKHGLMRLSNGDWNDEVVVGRVPDAQALEVREQGESVLNAAMASYVLKYYGVLQDYLGDSQGAEEARSRAEGQRRAVALQWSGSWFRRAWLDEKLGWIGQDRLWLEPQPWAILGGAPTAAQRTRLVGVLNQRLRKPSPIGALLQSKDGSGTSTGANGGIWTSINGTLIWALAQENGNLAWDEWQKNSLAAHAEAYPNIWYGIWSGPDTYNPVFSKYPGQTIFDDSAKDDQNAQWDWGLNWTDFPVMNMHPHAWPLYSASKLIGLEFHETGLRFRPSMPLTEYEFTSPLVGFRKSTNGYSGWYAPAVAGHWCVDVQLSSLERARVHHLKVNGVAETLINTGNTIHFAGDSASGAALRWELG